MGKTIESTNESLAQRGSDGSVFSEDQKDISRRGLLAKVTSLLGIVAAQALLPTESLYANTGEEDPIKHPGAPPRPYGKRSSFETALRRHKTNRSLTPLQNLHGIVTPSSLHFERHHNGVPVIDPSRHRLLIHGLVERPLIFTINELMRFPAVSRLAFIECSGNSGREWKTPKGKTVQDTHGLTSTSEWTGVSLATVLREVGVKPEALWVLAEGGDAAALTRSVPLDSILNEGLLCYAQNGEPLRPEQGYPIRLLMPGWEGNACVKWLRRLKLMSSPAMSREETSKYTDLMPDGTARQFTFVMEAKSVITSPSGGQRLTLPGFVDVRGLAWSGRGRITRVEVSTDGGQTWEEAELQKPVLSKCHTRFRFGWQWNRQEAILQSRCQDETGYMQPTRTELVAVRGFNSYYHNNAIQSWKVSQEGQVENVHV